MIKVICLSFFTSLIALASLAAPDPIEDDINFTIVEEDNLKGLFDEEGNMIIPIAYEDLGWTQGMPEVHSKVIGYRERNYWGLIDVKNRKVTEAIYYSLEPFVKKRIIASRGTTNSRKRVFGLIDHQGKVRLSFRYHSLSPHQEQLIAATIINDQPQYGVLDAEGQAIIGFRYNKIYGLAEGLYAVYNQQDKMALFSANGLSLSLFEYDSIAQFNEQGLAVVYQNGKQGVIRKDGVVIVPIQYRRVNIQENGGINVLPFSKWHVMSGKNEKLKSYTFENIEPAGINLYKVKLGDVSTFVDEEGTPVLSDNWQISKLEDDFAIVRKGQKFGVMSGAKSDEKKIILDVIYDTLYVDGQHLMAARKLGPDEYSWSMYNAAGEKLTYYAYQEIKKGSEGRYAVKRKGYWGYLNEKGEEVIPCQYLSYTPFSQGHASVDFLEGQGVIDQQGNWTIKPFKYKGASLQLERIHDNLYIFSTDAHHYEPAKYGLVDSEGHEIYVSHARLVDNGHTVWEINAQGKYGLISYQGARILPTKYDTISALQEGVVYTFEKDGHYGIMNRDGEILVDLDNNFQKLYPMSEHFLGVRIEDKYGFVDTLGRLRIANRYDSVTHFKSNMAAIKLLGRWGYINRSESLVVQPHFEKAFPFIEGLAVVSRDGKYGLVNKQGEVVVSTEYSKIYPAQHNRFVVEKNKADEEGIQIGLVSETGRQLIYPKYDSLDDLGNGYVIISRDGQYGLLTTRGMSTIPLKYDMIKYDPYNDHYLVLEKQKWKNLDVNIQVGQ
jgi:hypothetical protein